MDVISLLKSIFLLLAGVGVFIVGMNMMGDGLEKGAGNGLKRLLAKISNNRFAGIGIGTAVTGIIQSSSATSVMVIGLVNAGVMTLFQAISIIMGANIGTTVTGLIVALSGQKGEISFSDIAIILAFIGVMMIMLFKKDKIKLAGNIICGLGVIFVGLDIMSGALRATDSNGNLEGIGVVFKGFFEAIANVPGVAPILFILVGALFTAIIQSSSAATGIVITLAGVASASGDVILTTENALFIVLGSNIGTCVTALLACFGTGTNAKRTAFVHFTFNVIGTAIFTAFLWPTGGWFANTVLAQLPTKEMQIAIFHVIFNVTTTLVLCPFVKQLEKLSILVIKDKKQAVEERKLKFVDERLLVTPAIAYGQVKKEIGYMANLAKENVVASLAEINSPTKENPKLIYEREATINFTNKALTDFLIKLTSEATMEDEKHIGACFHVINDLERIGDHAKNFLEISEELIQKSLSLSQSAKDEVAYMASKIERMFELAIEVFESTTKPEACEVSAKLAELSVIESETDKLKKDYISNHFTRLAEGKCDASHSPYYMSIVTRLERVADHLINVGYSIVNPTGSQA